MHDFLDGLRSHISDRLRNPFVGAYVLSWIFVNYRVFLVALSDRGVYEKIAQIDFYMHGHWYEWVTYGVPFAIAVIYVVLSPLMTTVVLAYHLKVNQFESKLRRWISDSEIYDKQQVEQLFSSWSTEKERLVTKNAELRDAREQAEQMAEDYRVKSEGARQAQQRAQELELALSRAQDLSVQYKDIADAAEKKLEASARASRAEIDRLNDQASEMLSELNTCRGFSDILSAKVKAAEEELADIQIVVNLTGEILQAHSDNGPIVNALKARFPHWAHLPVAPSWYQKYWNNLHNQRT